MISGPICVSKAVDARLRAWRGAWAVGAMLLAGCGDAPREAPEVATADPGPVHVHGLGVDPADGSLFVATHTGLFRAPRGVTRARRVGGRHQDTMGFAVVGPNRFLGSGHPDLRERLPPFLGLIESRDAGRTWRAISLQGEVDFHVLEARGRRVYGYGSDFESREARLLASRDGGKTWRRLDPPDALTSLAIAPRDAATLVAAGERGVYRSRDGGSSWAPLDAPGGGLVAWTREGLFIVDREGGVSLAVTLGAGWRRSGSIGGEPTALDSGPRGELLVALHDGTIKRSADAGRTWTVRSRP